MACCIQLDFIPVAHERQWSAHGAFGGDVEHDRAESRAAQVRISDARHVAHPLPQQPVRNIVRCHAPNATADAVRRMDRPYVTDAAFKQPPIPHVSFSPRGTSELACQVREAAESSGGFRVMLLEEHGNVAAGRDLMDAFIWADLVEEMAQIAFIASAIQENG